MNKTIYLITALFPCLLSAQALSAMPSMTLKPVTFSVYDPAGNPVEAARIRASLPGPGDAEGQTDANGALVLQLSRGANLFINVSQEGYYRTSGEIWRGGMYKGPDGKLVARELPDQLNVQLKPVGQPVFMHHHRFRGHAPKTGEQIGYDLKVGDWLAPHGKGVTADMYFRFHDIFERDDAYAGTMTISFPNIGDGIQAFQAARPFSMEYGSDLAPPAKAPVDGYQEAVSYSLAYREGQVYQTYSKPQRNYLLRTRTLLDESGQILQACYGWVRGEIEFDPRGRDGPQLIFETYFNPDPDPEERSLEYNLDIPD